MQPRVIAAGIAVGLTATLTAGVATAAGSSSGYKACTNSSGVLAVLHAGHCPSGFSKTTIGATGPQGPQGIQGIQGIQGPPGPAASPAPSPTATSTPAPAAAASSSIVFDTTSAISRTISIPGTGLTVKDACSAALTSVDNTITIAGAATDDLYVHGPMNVLLAGKGTITINGNAYAGGPDTVAEEAPKGTMTLTADLPNTAAKADFAFMTGMVTVLDTSQASPIGFSINISDYLNGASRCQSLVQVIPSTVVSS